MSQAAPIDPLLAGSVIVTGTHYSATTLVGALLATAPEFHLLHEPLNPQPTLSYDSLRPPQWYAFYGEDHFERLQRGLIPMLRRRAIVPELLRRASRVRSGKEFGQVARYAQRRLPMLIAPRPAILKDPFLAFTARTLQQCAGTKVVLCLRHPGGFAESMVRKAGQFDFNDLVDQPALMEQLPDEAETIRHFAREPQPPLAQAALLWRVVYGFAERQLLPDKRTAMVRQEDFMGTREVTARRLLAFAGGSESPRLGRFLRRNFRTDAPSGNGTSYIRRDPQLATTQWRSALSAEEVRVVRDMTEPLAARLGYSAESWPH
ncbi:hypothetical protein [Parerythrobacter aestuarii]|uniref:hypothetical protein n=1 Tax=Parerythrobacter aestuarii TaxID=3020909 RepID=UPI0024DE7C03|nr:hypothetical protein [Parerythrobacter aestuarii]